jgi:hypothetical protein
VVIHSLRQQAEATPETPVAAEKAPGSNGKKAPAAKAKKAS